MAAIIVDTKDLNLPEPVAQKLGNTKVEIVETAEGVLLRPVSQSLLSARGVLKGKGFTTREYAELEEKEKALEK